MKTTGVDEATKTDIEAAKFLRETDAEHTFDSVAFDAAIAKWRGTATERMKRLGFNSTDEFIDAIRGRSGK